jgi:hypothetical protein
MDKISKAKERYEKAKIVHSDQWQIAMSKGSWEECESHLEPYARELAIAGREYRLIKEPIMTKIVKEFGDRMSVADFVACCKSGGFIDYDGSGTYVRGKEESNISIYPSDVKAGMVRKDFDEIIWYNK